MKYLTFLMFFFYGFSNAQALVSFRYDTAGNQTRRTITFVVGPVDPGSEGRIKNELEGISYYPNPVKEELFVKWTNEDGKYVESISIYNMSGQLLKSLPNLKGNSNQTILFSNYPVGVYNVVLVYNVGDRKTLKVIKG